MTNLFDQLKSKFSSKGHEIPDPTPVTIPVHLRKTESMDERIARIVQYSVSQSAAALGLETFEDADDFDIPDDPADPSTPYEQDFDLASAHAVDKGFVAKPDLSANRMAELRAQYMTPKPPEKEAPKKPQDDLLSSENA